MTFVNRQFQTSLHDLYPVPDATFLGIRYGTGSRVARMGKSERLHGAVQEAAFGEAKTTHYC